MYHLRILLFQGIPHLRRGFCFFYIDNSMNPKYYSLHNSYIINLNDSILHRLQNKLRSSFSPSRWLFCQKSCQVHSSRIEIHILLQSLEVASIKLFGLLIMHKSRWTSHSYSPQSTQRYMRSQTQMRHQSLESNTPVLI